MNKFSEVLALNFVTDNFEESLWSRLKSSSDKINLLSIDSPEIKSHLAASDCLLLKLGMSADKELINNMPKLKYIGMYGTGFGRIDHVYAASKGITVTNIADYATEGVAEFVFACLLENLREINRAYLQAKQGDYSESTYTGTEIKNKKFGVIGLGNIGKRVATIAKVGFKADVKYWDYLKKSSQTEDIKYAEISELMCDRDIISIHLALNEGTNGIINEELINKIKPGSILINTSPMELFDMNALKQRLQKGDITLILDHSDELSAEDAKQFASFQNCIMYPPIGYTTKEATSGKKEIFISNIEKFLKGKPTNKVN